MSSGLSILVYINNHCGTFNSISKRNQIVNEYIQKIIVHAPEKDKGIRTQRIQIVFNFADAVMDSPLNASAEIVTSRQAKTA